MTALSPHGLAAIGLALAMFGAFASGRLRVEIISLLTIGAIALGLFFFPLPGERPTDGLEFAFGAFGHYALVTICALMVLGRGLVVTGALDPVSRNLGRLWAWNRQLGLLVTLCLALGMSMLINDTPVLVLMLPILAQLSAKGAMPSSKTLIPVNAAILIGGMSTAIGTSTNLLVVSIAGDLGMAPIGIFQFTPTVLLAALIALPYMWLVMPRLLPDNSKDVSQEVRHFLALLYCDSGSAAIGESREALRKLLPEDVNLLPGPESRPLGGRRISVSGRYDSLVEAARLINARLAPGWLVDDINARATEAKADIVVAELIIAPDSRLIGLEVRAAGLAHVAVIGVHQARRLIMDTRARSADAPLAEGDVLLVMGLADDIAAFARADGLLMLEGGQEVARSAKARLAIVIMAASVGLASFGLLPIAISSLGGAILMFATGCVKFDRLGRALSGQVVVLVAASIALGKLVMVSGAAQWLGEVLASGLQGFPPSAVLAAIMLFVTILTNFASNTTAAAVGTPIAFNLATTLDMPPEPLVLAVLFGCNLCYATPVAYQTNMMILTEGDYRFADYLRSGVPLVLIMTITLSALLVMQYRL